MKKKILLTMLLSCSLISVLTSQNNQTNSSELLSRLTSKETEHGKDIHDVFTNAEIQQLNIYLEANIPKSSLLAPGDVYVVQTRNTCGEQYGKFQLQGPFQISQIVPTSTPIFGGDFDGNGIIYANNDDTDTLITIDKESGLELDVAPFGNLPNGHDITSLSWDPSTNTMYALSTNSTITNLYTVDLSNAVLSLIGETGTPSGVWLEIDDNGNAYMADTPTDSLYEVNLATGTASLIGALGVDIRFGQDADFDTTTGILYAQAYLGSGVNLFGTVDLNTGVFSSLGTVNGNCAQLGMLVIEPSLLGVNENLLNAIEIYPNPTDQFITINVSPTVSVEKLSVFDVLGNKTEVAWENGKIDMSELSAGLYVLVLETKNGMLIRRILKK